MLEVTWVEGAALVVAALFAGCVDAIAGGGGLLSLPALLAVGLPPHLALGTNKGQSVFGSGAALLRYSRAGLVHGGRARLAFPLGLLGSSLGAWLVFWIRPEVLRPLVLVLLGAAAAVVLFRPRVVPLVADPSRTRQTVAAGLALIIATYDGFFGPGTGSFLIVALVSVLGLPLARASAEAKVVNFASNLAAVALFAQRGAVLWRLALPMAAAQWVGGYVGAHWTVAGGDRVVRRVLLCVVAALMLKLGWDLWQHGGA
ncbi:MAG TPA: TSUP family transporter, partial [Myxococcaceae bacterium]|nr:TSUP family transporter [Myxococcaceae bacterium]